MTLAEYQQAQKDIADIKAQIAQLRDVVAKGVPAVREIYGADLPTQEPLPEAGASYQNVGALQFQQSKMMAGVEAAKNAVMPTTNAVEAIRGNPEDQGDTRRGIAKKLVEILTMGAGEAPDSTANAIANAGSGAASLIATAPAMLPLTVEQSVAGGIERGNPLAPVTDMAQAVGQSYQRQITGEAGGVTRGEAWDKTPVEEGFNLAMPLLAGLGIYKGKGNLQKKFTIKEARAAIKDVGKPKVDVPEVAQEPIRSETARDWSGKKFIHETDADFENFDINKAGVNTGEQWFGRGQYLQEEGAFKFERYGKNKKEYTIPNNLKILDSEELIPYVESKGLLPQNLKNKKLTYASEADLPQGYELTKFDDGNYYVFDKNGSAVDNVPSSDKDFALKKAYNKINSISEVGNITPKDVFDAVGRERLVSALRRDGYDGFYNDGELVVYNPEKLNKSITPVPTAVTPEPVTKSPQPEAITAEQVVAKAKPNAVTKDIKPLTPDELTAAQARLREKFKPMDEAVKPKPAEATKGKEPWIMRPVEFRGGVASVFETPAGNITKIKSTSKAAGMGGERWRAEYGGVEYDALTPDQASQWLKQQSQSPDLAAKYGAGKPKPAEATKGKEPWEMTREEAVENGKFVAVPSHREPNLNTPEVAFSGERSVDRLYRGTDGETEIGHILRTGYIKSTSETASRLGKHQHVGMTFYSDRPNVASSYVHRDGYVIELDRSKVTNVSSQGAGEVSTADAIPSSAITRILRVGRNVDGNPYAIDVTPEVLADYPDLAAKYGAGKISTEPTIKPTPDAGATPAQSIETPKLTEYEEFLKKSEAAREEARVYAEEQIRRKQQNDAELKAREDERIARANARAKETAPPIPKTAEEVVGKAKGIETPLSGAKEIKSELNTTKIDHKQFKSEINDRLDKMIAEAPTLESQGVKIDAGGSNYSKGMRTSDIPLSKGFDFGKYGFSRVTIEIPGDGTFKIWNTKEHLAELKKLANRAKLPGEDEALRKFAPYNQGLSEQLARNSERNRAGNGKKPKTANEVVSTAKGEPTELHSGINPFKIIDDYMTKRKLVNPVGTPEHVLSGKGIVEPFRKAQESMRNELKSRGELLQKTLEGVKRESDEDVAIFKKLDDPKATLDAREQALRDYYNALFNEVNKHRKARGQQTIKYRKGYITHLPNDKLLTRLIDAMEKGSRDLGDTPMPKRFRFQFEKAREGSTQHRISAIDALEVYTKAALKDIYIGDALAETVPKINAMGGKPLVFKKSVTTPDGKTTNQTFYQWTDSPIMTERGYAESFIKGQMNVPTSGQRNLKAMFGIEPNTSTRTALGISAAFYRSLLGFAIDSSVKNLTQGINTMAEMGVLPTMKGYIKLVTPKGLKAARAEHLLEDFNPMLMEGHDLPMRSKVGKAIGKGFTSTLNAPMKVAEFINRGAAYHAAYDVYIKKGMSLEQAHEAARAAVRKTQFSYSKVDTSPALRGPFARIASQFLSYPIKQSEMMYNWAVKPGEQGKLIRYFLYTGMAVMGAKYAGVDLSGIFFDPIKMVDPNSKEGFQLPGSDKRVAFDMSKLGKSGYTPQGFAPTVSIPADFIKSQMSDQESTREYGREKALFNVLPGGRYGKKVYDVLTERDELGARDRKTRENTDKDKVLKLLGGRSTEREAETSRRESVVEVEKKYYATRQKLIDLRISGDMDEFNKVRDDFRDKYPFLYGRLMKGFDAAVKEERKKKGMTTDERFFDNSLRKQIDANL